MATEKKKKLLVLALMYLFLFFISILEIKWLNTILFFIISFLLLAET